VRGLGLLPYSNCVHYDDEPARHAEYHRFIGDGMRPGFAADDGVALHFRGTLLERVVSARERAFAYRVEPYGKSVIEFPLEVTQLGAHARARTGAAGAASDTDAGAAEHVGAAA
jgi:hypothetical protein